MTRVLLISIVPLGILGAARESLRARYPGAAMTVLMGHPTAEPTDEVMSWRGLGAWRLLSEIRRRRFDIAAIIHGGDQYHSRAFWKAAVIATLSGASAKWLVETPECRILGPLSSAVLVLRSARRASGRLAMEAYFAALALPLLLILFGVAATDLAEALVGRGRKPPQGQQK